MAALNLEDQTRWYQICCLGFRAQARPQSAVASKRQTAIGALLAQEARVQSKVGLNVCV